LRIIAVNGSPRKDKVSKTAMMLESFISGCRQEGAAVELINLREKDIKMCTGCYACWTKSPGECAFRDDMKDVLTAVREADLEIWATPLYFFGPTAMFKNFLDRSIPMAEPFIIKKDDLCSHPLRGKSRHIVFMSVAGFYESDHFQPMSDWLHFMERRGLIKIIAEIYRPESEFMSAPQLKERVAEVLASAEQAGRELVRNGSIDKKTITNIQQEIIPDQQTYIDLANKYWSWAIERNRKHREKRN